MFLMGVFGIAANDSTLQLTVDASSVEIEIYDACKTSLT